MKIQVFDLGNTYIKCDIWDIEGGRDPKLLYNHHTPTSKDMKQNLEVCQNAYNHNEKDAVIVISMSDSVVYESPEGQYRWIPAGEPTHPYARRETLPPYRETGKPHAEVLQGVFNQLRMVMTQVNLRGFSKMRILPMSGAVASYLAGDKSFKNWDITHASNSGVFNYQIKNPTDERFPKRGWHYCIEDIIDAGIISEAILPSHHVLHARDGTPILLGGHDTTFVNGLHTPYTTKPYISCGTWLTVSVEASLRPDWKDEGARYVVAPNGAVLKQLCFPSPTTDSAKIMALQRTHDFLCKHLPEGTEVPIRIFGSWRNTFHQMTLPLLKFQITCMHSNYLTEQAAYYASVKIEEH